MLRELLIFGTVVLYIETILQVYLLINNEISTTAFIALLVCICGSHAISNMASVILILKNRVTESSSRRLYCCMLHLLQLGLIWRLVRGRNVDSYIHDLRLFHCGLQTLPFMIIHGSSYLSKDMFGVESVTTFITLIVSCLSASLIVTSYTLKNSLDYQTESLKVTFPRRLSGIILISLGTYFMLACRIGTIILMGTVETIWILIPLGFHFVVLMMTYMTCSSDITCQVKPCTSANILRFTSLAYFNIFDLIESNLRVIQCKYVAFYTLILVENTVMAAVWLLYADKEYVAKLLTVVFVMVLFFSALILKYTGCCFLIYGSTPTSLYETSKKHSQSFTRDTLQSSCRTDVFIRQPNSQITHVTTSVGDQSTETILSNTTMASHNPGTESKNCSRMNADITPPTKSSKSHTRTHKRSKKLSKRLLFGQTFSLFHFPKTSTLKSTQSFADTVCVSSVEVGDVTDDILQKFRSKSKRVRGRQDFRLGVHRSKSSKEDDLLRRSLPRVGGHTKLHRTNSLHVNHFQDLDVRRLPHISGLMDSLDYSQSYATTSDDDNVNVSSASSSSRLRLESSGTDMSLSSITSDWTSWQKPHFENLDSLPTKIVDSQKRIRTWLSETVSIFDRFSNSRNIEKHRESLQSVTRYVDRKRSRQCTDPRSYDCNVQRGQGNHQESSYPEIISPNRAPEFDVFHMQLPQNSVRTNYNTERNIASDEASNKRVYTIRTDDPLYENVYGTSSDQIVFNGIHVNSLDRIDQLKQYIYSTDSASTDRHDNGDNTIDKNLLRNHTDGPLVQKHIPHINAHCESKTSSEVQYVPNHTHIQFNRDTKSRVSNRRTHDLVRKSMSCPKAAEQSPVESGYYVINQGNIRHKTLMPIESLV